MPLKRGKGTRKNESATATADPGGPITFRIFLNYRREDASGHAGRLYDFLRHGGSGGAGFSKQQIFMDIDTIAPGVDFRRVIEDAVGSCDVFIAVIGRRWVEAVDAKGKRRLDNAADFVRLEIEAALARGIPVVPALVQGAGMPSVEDLPESLHDFAHRNAVELSDARWAFDVGRLADWLKTVAEEKPGRERAERERLEREAMEQAERERQKLAEAERSERERQRREAAKQAERERLDREAAAKTEAAERETRERLEHERAEKAQRERTEQDEDEPEDGKSGLKPAATAGRWPRQLRLRLRHWILIGVVVAGVGAAAVIAVVRSGAESPPTHQVPDENDAFPNLAEKTLMKSIPANLVDTCSRSEADSYNGALAEVVCVAPKVGEVVYRSPQDSERESDYLFGGFCQGVPATWKHGEICQDDAGAGSSLYWIDDQSGVSGSVRASDLTPFSLWKEWDCCLRFKTLQDLADELRS